MKIFVDKITVESYELAMDIIKGLEHGPSKTKYECMLEPPHKESRMRPSSELFNIGIYAIEDTDDKTPIGFADAEEK